MTSSPPPSQAPSPAPPLRRAPRQKVVAGVCGGLGRHFDLDPVIFRIVVGVLSVTGGLGLIFYGFAWLVLPADGEEENEARRLLTGRVDGAALVAVLMALVGCGLFLSMLRNGGTLAFSVLLGLAVAGASVWSQRRRLAVDPEGPGPLDAATAGAVADAPPETMAPPPPGSPSWWRDPIVKDGTTGPVTSGYLWGPADSVAVADPARPVSDPDHPWRAGGAVAARAPRGPRGIGGVTFLLAVVGGALATAGAWGHQPLGTSLQIGLAVALAVFGLGLVVGAFLGRIGFGTIVLTVLTAALLAGASAVPDRIGTDWEHRAWRPTTVASVQQKYELGSGDATLDLSAVAVPPGSTLRTRADVGAGRLRVVVPRDATVRVRADVGLGDLRLPGEPADDIDVSPDQSLTRTLKPPAGAEPAGTLELSLDVTLGQVEVTRAAS
ncbi:PspC domain-containing protein [Streptomyces sp. NPDC001941]|uniref:PspC domain-containing protein n=1 Tax=Streptomyces sp. NPDC001941 TaxID=3154659 RepID=UPI003330CAD3